MSSQIFMVCSLRGKRLLKIHVGYQHTKYIWRKAKRTSERKSSWQQKYALGIPIKGRLWLSPWTYAVWFVYISVNFAPWFGKSNRRRINSALFLNAVMNSWLWHTKWHLERKSSFDNPVDFSTSLLPQSSESNLLFRGPNHSIASAGQKENNLFT